MKSDRLSLTKSGVNGVYSSVDITLGPIHTNYTLKVAQFIGKGGRIQLRQYILLTSKVKVKSDRLSLSESGVNGVYSSANIALGPIHTKYTSKVA